MKKINYLREMRNERMMCKSELARKAGITLQTVIRIENGEDCHLSTKRKLLEALGISIADRALVFPVEKEQEKIKNQRSTKARPRRKTQASQ